MGRTVKTLDSEKGRGKEERPRNYTRGKAVGRGAGHFSTHSAEYVTAFSSQSPWRHPALSGFLT
jgi:hypothetical protein